MTGPTTSPVTTSRGRTFLGLAGPVALAHRGSAVHPENSLAAFEDAVVLGHRLLETDVHVTADGVLVALHDPTVDRTTDSAGPLAALTWDEASRLRLRDAAGAVTEHAPVRLEDLLDAWADATPRVRLNVDVKEVGAVAPLVDLLAARPADAARVCIASFSDARRRAVVAGLADRGVRVTSSAGTAGVARFLAGAHLGLRGRALRALVAADALQVPPATSLAGRRAPLVTRALVAAAHSAGIVVHVWTVDDPDEMRHLFDIGVDGVVTDDAAAAVEVLRERGAWPPREATPGSEPPGRAGRAGQPDQPENDDDDEGVRP